MISKFRIGTLVILLGLFISATAWAEGDDIKYSPIEMAVPSLIIAPDARGGGMSF